MPEANMPGANTPEANQKQPTEQTSPISDSLAAAVAGASDGLNRPRYGPGYIHLDLGHGRIVTNNRMEEWATTDAMNSWFEEHGQGCILLWIGIKEFTYAGGLKETRIIGIVGKELTSKESDMYTRIQRRVQQLVNEEMRIENEAALKEEEAKREQEKERIRLESKGRDCEKHHAELTNELVELKKQVKALKRAR